MCSLPLTPLHSFPSGFAGGVSSGRGWTLARSPTARKSVHTDLPASTSHHRAPKLSLTREFCKLADLPRASKLHCTLLVPTRNKAHLPHTHPFVRMFARISTAQSNGPSLYERRQEKGPTLLDNIAIPGVSLLRISMPSPHMRACTAPPPPAPLPQGLVLTSTATGPEDMPDTLLALFALLVLRVLHAQSLAVTSAQIDGGSPRVKLCPDEEGTLLGRRSARYWGLGSWCLGCSGWGCGFWIPIWRLGFRIEGLDLCCMCSCVPLSLSFDSVLVRSFDSGGFSALFLREHPLPDALHLETL